MATGVPQSPTRDQAGAYVQLAYPGKQAVADILRTPPEIYETVAVGKGDPDRRLYYSENLMALAHLSQDSATCGNVRLVYIDPPFATQTVFHSRKLTHAYKQGHSVLP